MIIEIAYFYVLHTMEKYIISPLEYFLLLCRINA